jgi:hypothetical protein
LEDAFQQPAGRFVVAAFGAGKLGFGGDEATLACGLEDCGSVTLEVGLGTLQGRYRRVQPRELLLDLGDDQALLV